MSLDTVLVVTLLTLVVFLVGELVGYFNSRKRIRELEARIELLKGYTHHKVGCRWNSKPVARINEFEVIRQPCSCGLHKALEAERDETCKWQHDLISIDSYTEYDSWATSCGETFAILEEWHEKPAKFCLNCGKKVEALD